MEIHWFMALLAAVAIGIFIAYTLLHYILFLLATRPRNASDIGHELNEFERRQLVEWVPKAVDFLKHDDEHRTYDDVFGSYRSALDHYCTCVFPRTIFSHAYMADDLLLQLQDGMRLLDLGCGSGAAADYFATRHQVAIVCVTNSPVQGDICRRRFQKFGGSVRVIVIDFDKLDLDEETFDTIYAFESVGYSKNIDAWLERCWRMLKPGGRLLIR